MANALFERIAPKNTLHRFFDIIILLLLLSLLVYRVISLPNHGFAWVLALLCESWFTSVWIIIICTKWTPVEYKTYPQRLPRRVEEFPAVDIFVTTADPKLEPPILTVNTVISVLAVDYPPQKLACYVSDDGCSALTFYSLLEASKFAEIWVPFCKKYNITDRAPFRYFSSESVSTAHGSLEFERECTEMRVQYGELCRKINDATRKSIPGGLVGDLAVFSDIDRRNHPTVIKVIWEYKEHLQHGLPHLIYLSREKQPKHPHHHKAGAMNVLTRVSGLLTNAPYMLNLDCDNFVNNPQIVRQAMCFFLNSRNGRETAFVQFPQKFYGALKDDPFGCQYAVLYHYLVKGVEGIQGSTYQGTGCFHRRQVIYGLCPDGTVNQAKVTTCVDAGDLAAEQLKAYGRSKEFIESANDALQGKTSSSCLEKLSHLVDATREVAGCGYEYGSGWGTEVGWLYGSATEDILTGLKIQARGWKPRFYSPDPPGFLGCSPTDVPVLMAQQKRWVTGMLEILISKRNPVVATITSNLQFRQCLAYLSFLNWSLRPIPELCYALLPAYSIITNSTLLPPEKEATIGICLALFTTYNVYTLLEYLQVGLSSRAWWNNMRMLRINAINPWLFGFFSAMLSTLGFSETAFQVTQKDDSSTSSEEGGEAGRFTFNGSPIFLPGTALSLLHLTALTMKLLGFQPPVSDVHGSGMGEMLCSLWVLMCFWPFVKGLVGRGKYGIPWPTICKSALLTLFFVQLCKMMTSSV